MQIEEDSFTGEVQFAKCELCGMIFNFLPADHKCMQPKSIAEVGKLFEEKSKEVLLSVFSDSNGNEYNTFLNERPVIMNKIKQFWLEHFKSLLEEMRMETEDENEGNLEWRAGHNFVVDKINKHLDNLLSKGE